MDPAFTRMVQSLRVNDQSAHGNASTDGGRDGEAGLRIGSAVPLSIDVQPA